MTNRIKLRGLRFVTRNASGFLEGRLPREVLERIDTLLLHPLDMQITCDSIKVHDFFFRQHVFATPKQTITDTSIGFKHVFLYHSFALGVSKKTYDEMFLVYCLGEQPPN